MISHGNEFSYISYICKIVFIQGEDNKEKSKYHAWATEDWWIDLVIYIKLLYKYKMYYVDLREDIFGEI